MATAYKQQDCPRCPNPILPGQQIVLRKGHWIHSSCAPGADDE